MIPALTLIVGAYVVLRCFEIGSKPKDHFNHKTMHVVVVCLCVVVALIAIVGTLDVMLAGMPSHRVPETSGY